jgi:hypothetical protein
MKYIVIFVLFISITLGCIFGASRLFAQVVVLDAKDMISENYQGGPYLIYDCVEGHWVCVSKSYFDDCEKKRKSELESDDFLLSRSISCAPFELMPSKQACFQRQLFLTSHYFGTTFCQRDK